MNKSAILVVSFGTSHPRAMAAIDNLIEAAKISFPDYEVRLAFTSKIIRNKLSNAIPNPVEALAKLNAENFSEVVIMPTLMIPGQEYDALKDVYESFKHLTGKYGFEKLALGTPFMNTPKDCERWAKILAKLFESEHAGIILMGHGTREHFAHALYSQLQLELDRIIYGKFFVGTVEAAPDIHDVITNLKRHDEIHRLILSPLMIVAGEHANNDLANEWLNALKANGYENVNVNLKGLGEEKLVASYFVDRLRKTMSAL